MQGHSFRFSDQQRGELERVLTRRHCFPNGRFHGGEAVTLEVVVERLERFTTAESSPTR
jgi:hypothetical protein